LGHASFFFNLYTCSGGNQVSGLLGVEPPSVPEYLFSVHHNLLVPLPGIDESDDLVDPDAIALGHVTYYHVYD